MRDVQIPLNNASPKGSKRGCLCWDTNTYSKKCCDGSLQAQGVGSLVGQGTSVIVKGEEWETINRQWDSINTLWQDL